MTDEQIVEVLQSCRPVYNNLHYKIGHDLSEQEIALLRQFKFVWEDSLCLRPDLVKQSGIGQAEIAFLGGFVYYSHQLTAR